MPIFCMIFQHGRDRALSWLTPSHISVSSLQLLPTGDFMPLAIASRQANIASCSLKISTLRLKLNLRIWFLPDLSPASYRHRQFSRAIS